MVSITTILSKETPATSSLCHRVSLYDLPDGAVHIPRPVQDNSPFASDACSELHGSQLSRRGQSTNQRPGSQESLDCHRRGEQTLPVLQLGHDLV